VLDRGTGTCSTTCIKLICKHVCPELVFGDQVLQANTRVHVSGTHTNLYSIAHIILQQCLGSKCICQTLRINSLIGTCTCSPQTSTGACSCIVHTTCIYVAILTAYDMFKLYLHGTNTARVVQNCAAHKGLSTATSKQTVCVSAMLK